MPAGREENFMYRTCLALLAACAAGVAQSQTAMPPAGDYQAMLDAMQAAQAEANQPGDENLSCDQLQQQVVAVAQDPAFQAFVQKAGAAAQKDMAAMEAAKGEIAAKTAATMVASMVPGAAMGHMMAGAAEAQAKQAQAAERVQSIMSQGQELMALMPTLMRGQRLIELGGAKSCEWAASAMSAAAPAQ
jgi:hypothetical protein